MAEELRVLGAGSLREVMGEVSKRYEQTTGALVVAGFGPSGLLRERIEKGEHADLFASADMGHPLQLLRDGRATRVAMFARNTLCGIAAPQIALTAANFLDRFSIQRSSSAPRRQRRIPPAIIPGRCSAAPNSIRPGSYEILDKKAQQIVGGAANNLPSMAMIRP